MAFGLGLLWTVFSRDVDKQPSATYRIVLGLVLSSLIFALLRLVYTAWTLQEFNEEVFSFVQLAQIYVAQAVLVQVACLLLTLIALLAFKSVKFSLLFLTFAMLGTALTGHVAAVAENLSQLIASILHIWLAQL